jgi:hypothetical protein
VLLPKGARRVPLYGTLVTKQTPETIAAELTVPERLLLFCLATDTDWQKAGVTHATAQHMMVRALIERDRAATRFALTDQGRTVLGALLATR